jgi:hypothetical protein
MKPLMKLRWEGDQDTMFARHVGHTVTVEGAVSSGETGQVLNVKTVKEVSDSCMRAKENSRGRATSSTPTCHWRSHRGTVRRW